MKEWLIVDGYNVINDWQDFRKLREENLEHARAMLVDKISEYVAFKGYHGIVVFDAQDVQGTAKSENIGGLDVAYTETGRASCRERGSSPAYIPWCAV